MQLRHKDETGIAVDHWAALVLEGGRYSVASVPDSPGSVGADGKPARLQLILVPNVAKRTSVDRAAGNFVADGSGTPGVWLKEVRDGAVHSAALPRVSTR